MKLIHTAFAFLFTLSLVTTCTTLLRAEDPVWKPLADGKTLAHWHKNGQGDWTVEDGAYVGARTKRSFTATSSPTTSSRILQSVSSFNATVVTAASSSVPRWKNLTRH